MLDKPYSDYESWSNAVTGISTVTLPNATAYLGQASTSATFDGVTFATDSELGDPHMYLVATSITSTIPVVSVQQGTRGLTNLILTFPTEVNAFALNYGTFSRFTGINLVILSTRDSEFLPGSGDGYTTGGFIGVVGWTPFQTVHFASSITDWFNVGNVAYANAEAAPVPEPGTLTLFGLGAVGRAGLARRRHLNG